MENSSCHRSIVALVSAARQVHRGFVPFPGEEYGILVDGHANGVCDSFTTIGNDGEVMPPALTCGLEPADDPCDDRVSILCIWVVICDDREVGVACGHTAHREAAVPIPLSDAAKDGDQPPSRAIAEDGDDALERIRSVGEIDDYRERLPFIYEFHSARSAPPGP